MRTLKGFYKRREEAAEALKAKEEDAAALRSDLAEDPQAAAANQEQVA